MTGRSPFQYLFQMKGSFLIRQTFKQALLQAKTFSERFSSTDQPSFNGSMKARWQRFKIEMPKAYEGIKRDLSDPTYVLFNVSLLIGFIGSCIPDELYLRYCAVLSSSGAIFYNTFMFHGSKFSPNLTMMAWDAFRAAAHASNIFRIWHEKSDVNMSEKQEKMYAQHFMDFGMRPRQFMKLLNSSKGEAVFGSRECLVQQGEVADPKTKKLYLLLKGTVNAEVNGRVIATLSEDTPLCFFGEMQLLDLAENGILHRKLMKSSFVDLYECTRIIAHRHDHKHRDGRGSDFDPSDILGYTAEEMEMQEAELFEGEMKDSNVSEGVDAKAQTDEVVSATSETTTATQVETDAAAATTSNQVVISDHNASTSSVMSFVVPEGSTARVLVWDGEFVMDMIKSDDDFATQFKLVLYASVRMKLKVLAVRTFEKVYEALMGGCLSDGVINGLEKQALDSYRREHNISDEMNEKIIEQCGWTVQEYKQGAKSEQLHTDKVVSSLISNYDGLLHGIVADGIVNAIERKALDMHRSDHNINDKYHEQALARLGWTLEDFERGFKLPVVETEVKGDS